MYVFKKYLKYSPETLGKVTYSAMSYKSSDEFEGILKKEEMKVYTGCPRITSSIFISRMDGRIYMPQQTLVL